MRPTILDLFSGIGGFSLAFERAGFSTIGFSEVEPFACQVLKKHWPKIKNFGDIAKWRDWPDLVPDVITGGFPCQPFSQAGKQRGAKDDRFLWPAMLDIIARYRPAWVVGENVAGLINMELDRCFTDLENIGYKVQPIIIPACAIGAFHERKRVWIIAHNDSIKRKSSRTCESKKRTAESTFCGGSIDSNNDESKRASRRKVKPAPPIDVDAPRSFGIWLSKPVVGRVVHGIHSSMDISRLSALGNSIVPQIAEIIAQSIYQISYEGK